MQLRNPSGLFGKAKFDDRLGHEPFQYDFDTFRNHIRNPRGFGIAAVRDHLKLLDDPDLRSAYYDHRKSIVEEVRDHAILCEEWAATTKVNRSQEFEDARQDRKNAIIDRLTDPGWGYEIEQLVPRDNLGLHALVKQPTRLTDRIWKNIEAPLVQYMETMKTERLKREREALIICRKPAATNVLRAYKISHLPLTEVMPEPVDFCAFPEVQAVLELPNDVDVDESTFSEVVPLLPSIFDRWRTDIIQKLADRVRQAQEDERELREQDNVLATTKPTEVVVEDPAEKMKLVTTVFKCRKCLQLDDAFGPEDRFHQLGDMSIACHRPFASADFSGPLFYPKVLGHRCLTVVLGELYDLPCRDPSIKLNMDFSPWVPYRFRHRQGWDPKCLAIDPRAGEMVGDIIRICGLDPATTTVGDMDELDARLGCSECTTWEDADQVTSITVFGWRTAVQHQARCHKDKTVSWITLDEDERHFARLVEDTVSTGYAEHSSTDEEDFRPPSNVVSWMCAHCVDLQSQLDPQELHVTIAHLNTVHQVESPVLNEDYFQDFEAPQGYRTDTLFNVSAIDRPGWL